MKKSANIYISCILCSWVASSAVYSQSRVSGKVESAGKSVAFANVLLLSSQDSSLVKGMVTNEKGIYQADYVKPGQYLLLTSMVGYKKAYSTVFSINSEKVELKTIQLEEDSKQLNEVTVVTSKPLYEQQIDKLVVNVQSSITAAGSTALDVLERSPGISLNRQNNTLSMNGKQGIVVMINGKISRLPMEAVLQMLSGMNAANIEKIELIAIPSASYDAEGNAGMINIVVRKNTDLGTNGSYAATVGYGWYEKAAASVNLNHRTSKLNLFGDGSFSWDHFMFQIDNKRKLIYENQLIESNTLSKRYSYQMSYNARLGFDYILGPQTSLSGLVSGFNNRWEQFCKNNAHIYQSGEKITHIYMQDHELNHWRNLMGNLNLHHVFNTTQEINFDLDHLYYHHSNPHWYINNYQYFRENTDAQEQMNNVKLTPIHMWVSKADYVKMIGKHSRLETGLKGTVTRLKNKVVFDRLIDNAWQHDPEFGQHVKMQEDIGAVYVNLHHQLNARTKIQTGLRWEFTHTDLTSIAGENLVKRRYNNLFPSAFISRELNDSHSLQLSYSRRITRPTFGDLAPFVNFWDPYSFISGNTALKPTITHALQATYQLKKKYIFSFQYSHDYNSIAWFVQVDPEKNEQFTSKENIRSANTYALNLNIPVTIAPWWQMQNNLMGNWQQNETEYQGEIIRISGGYGRLNTTQNFTLPKGYALEFAYFYQTRALVGIGYQKSFGFLNAGIQKKLSNNRGTLQLTGSDLFWTNRFSVINQNPQLNQDVAIIVKFEPHVIKFTYSRNFGNQNVKAAKQRSTGSEEERKRVQ